MVYERLPIQKYFMTLHIHIFPTHKLKIKREIINYTTAVGRWSRRSSISKTRWWDIKRWRYEWRWQPCISWPTWHSRRYKSWASWWHHGWWNINWCITWPRGSTTNTRRSKWTRWNWHSSTWGTLSTACSLEQTKYSFVRAAWIVQLV